MPKLSDLNPNEIKLVSQAAPSSSLKLSDLHPDDIQPAVDNSLESIGSSALAGIQRGATLGFAPRIAGLAGALGGKAGGDTRDFSEIYKEAKDAATKDYAQKEAEHPNITTASELASGLLVPIPGGPAETLAGHALTGAGIGAVAGAGNTQSDNLSDIAKGALGGAATGAVVGSVAPMVGGNKIATLAGGGLGYALAPEDEKLKGTLLGAGAGALAGNGLGAVYDNVLSNIPIIEQPLQQLRVNASGVDTLTQGGRDAIIKNATDAVTGPADIAKANLRENVLDPANQKLADLASDLADKINSGNASDKEQLIAEQLNKAKDTLDQLEQLGGAAGKAVGAIKEHIANSDNTTSAVSDGLEALQNFVSKNSTLKNNETAQDAINEYKSWISDNGDALKVGSKASDEANADISNNAESTASTEEQETPEASDKGQASGQQYLDTVQGLKDLANRSDIKGTYLQKVLNQVTDLVDKTGRSDFLDNATVTKDDLARQQYGAYKQLQEDYGISPNQVSTPALLKQVQNISQIPDTAQRAAQTENFLDIVGKLSPTLKDNLQNQFATLQQQTAAVPAQVSPESVASVLNNEAPSAVQKASAPQAIIQKQDFLANANKQIDPDEVQNALQQASKLGQIREDTLSDIKNLDVNNLLNALQNSEKDGISPRYKLEKFYQSVEAADPDLAQTLKQQHGEQLDALIAAHNMSSGGSHLAGMAKNLLNVLGAGLGKGVGSLIKGYDAVSSNTVRFLQNSSPEMFQDYAKQAINFGNTRLSSYLNKAATQDVVGRSATLYLISQDPSLRDTLNQINPNSK